MMGLVVRVPMFSARWEPRVHGETFARLWESEREGVIARTYPIESMWDDGPHGYYTTVVSVSLCEMGPGVTETRRRKFDSLDRAQKWAESTVPSLVARIGKWRNRP
jgi:hypothetical protein